MHSLRSSGSFIRGSTMWQITYGFNREGESFIRGSVSDHILLQHQTPPQAYLKVSGADDLSSVELGNSENGSVKEGITRSLNGAPSRSPLWSAHEEQTHRSLGNPRTTGVKPRCIASSWDRTPDLPKEAKVDTHLIWKTSSEVLIKIIREGYAQEKRGIKANYNEPLLVVNNLISIKLTVLNTQSLTHSLVLDYHHMIMLLYQKPSN
ncbi:hypothetical protein LXL04_022141 [Taraxacum kok-saghyz]